MKQTAVIVKPETRFKIKVQGILRHIPELFYEKIQQTTIRGTPDLLLCYRGHFVAWELKVGDNKVDALQMHKLQLIKESGGIARVVTPENLEKCLEELLCLEQ